MSRNPDIDQLRGVLNDAAVLCGRLSSAVSLGELKAECAGAIAAARNAVLAAQQAAGVIVQLQLLAQLYDDCRQRDAIQKALR